MELLKKTGAAPSVLLKHDGSAPADGEGGAAAAVAPKQFSAKVHFLRSMYSFLLMSIQDTKKKKRAPKAGSLEDWESEGQSASLGEFFCIFTHRHNRKCCLFCTAFRASHARQTAACWF